MSDIAIVPVERIERAILVVRGHRVLLDEDLSTLYGVEIKALNQSVRRNTERFPGDFMFQLTPQESKQIRIKHGQHEMLQRTGRGRYRKYLAYAFTEQGVAMLSSVLSSARAVQVNIEIMRAFVRLRQMLHQDAELTRKLEALEMKYDAQFKVVFDAIRELMKPPIKPRRRIGFGEVPTP